MPETSLKLVRDMLEVLQDGTERGKPVAVSGNVSSQPLLLHALTPISDPFRMQSNTDMPVCLSVRPVVLV